MMTSICRVCLRTDRNIYRKDPDLCTIIDKLCVFKLNEYTRFCTECAYMLVKFNSFREKCQLATDILQTWMNEDQAVRVPIKNLSEKIPPSGLSLCHSNNFKVYIFQTFQLNPLSTLEIEDSKDPHIIAIDIPEDENYSDSFEHQLPIISNESDNNVEPSIEVKQEIIEEEFNNTIKVLFKEVQLDNVGDSNSNEIERICQSDANNDNSVSNIEISNLSLDNLIPKKVVTPKNVAKKRKLYKSELAKDSVVTNKKAKRRNENLEKKISMGELKQRLAKRFSKCGVLEDKDGRVIDTNVIMHSLADLSLSVLRQLKNQVAIGFSSEELQPEGIKLLATLHKKYANRDSNAIDNPIIETSHKSDKTSGIATADVDIDTSTDEDIKCEDLLSDDETIANKVARTNGQSDLGQKVGNVKSDEKKRVIRNKAKGKISIEELRRRLQKAFSIVGELKDEEGTVIDTDLILNSLGILRLLMLRRLKKQFARSRGCIKKGVTPDSMRLLSILNKKLCSKYVSGFTVEHLPDNASILEEFAKRQYYEQYINAEYKCEQCYTAFRNNRELKNHIGKAHNDKNQYACFVCNTRYSKKSSIGWHLIKHRTVYKCKLCPFVTNQKGSMIPHFNQHKGVMYACEVCDAQFKSRSGQYLHMNTAHREKNIFICKVCGRKFSSDCGLKIHYNRKHKGQENIANANEGTNERLNDESNASMKSKQKPAKRSRSLYCPVCKKKESSVAGLRRHFGSEHPCENFEAQYIAMHRETHKYLCHICGRVFSSSRSLEEHKNFHTGDRPYSCDVCGAKFMRKGILSTHIESHLIPTKECDVCGKKFTRDVLLANHMSYHKPPTIPCHLCGKKFWTSSNLYCHMRTHIGDRRYKCDICQKTFLHSSALKAHVRGVHNHTHIGDRRYKCDICQKTFLHSSALKAHVRGVHNHVRRERKHAKTYNIQ